MKLRMLTCLFLLFGLAPNEIRAQSFFRELVVDPDDLIGGPRINYMQGKDGFVGLAFNLGWNETGYLPLKHIGFAIGSDIKLSNSFLMAPKVTLEYRYLIGIVRLGYLYYTDFNRKFENRVSAEIGFSLIGFADLTYVHTFGFNNDPFNLGNDYLNLTISFPLIIKSL